jgi:hypothetical protein
MSAQMQFLQAPRHHEGALVTEILLNRIRKNSAERRDLKMNVKEIEALTQ